MVLNRRRFSIAAIALFLITLFAYFSGLSGPFLFDDFPNLEKLGALGPIESWELFRAYLASGFSGPTGRPIALASFLLDANDWPADPAGFKYTNLVIHLLVGLTLLLTLNKLLRSIGRSEAESYFVSLVATSLWLLNPYLVSTTLYVVQRMTQLSALFMLIGILGYLQGRLWIASKPFQGHIAITVSVVGFTFLATFSKENGALLPLLIFVLEFSLRHHWRQPGPDWRWTAVFLLLPSIAIGAYLVARLPGLEQAIPQRGWSLLERLLTQPRMLWDYLFHLFVPHIQTRGLYQDDIVVSTTLFSPRTTLLSLIGLIGILVAGLISRKRWPLGSLAILFYLAAHLIESSTISLELYFEHRNYLPATFLFLPIASGFWVLRSRVQTSLVLVMAVTLTGTFALATAHRASLWGNEAALLLVWAEKNPLSPRAQVAAAQIMIRKGMEEQAVAHLQDSMLAMPRSVLLTSNLLATKAALGHLSNHELQEGADRIRKQPFDAQMFVSLEHLVESLNRSGPWPEKKEIMLQLLHDLSGQYGNKIPMVVRFGYFLEGVLLAGHGEGQSSLNAFRKALSLYGDIDAGMKMVSILALNGHFGEALELILEVERVLHGQSERGLKHSRNHYLQEIERVRGSLKADIADRAVE